jgi:hypothetical protein
VTRTHHWARFSAAILEFGRYQGVRAAPEAAFALIESAFVETSVALAVGSELFRQWNPNQPATGERSRRAIIANLWRSY